MLHSFGARRLHRKGNRKHVEAEFGFSTRGKKCIEYMRVRPSTITTKIESLTKIAYGPEKFSFKTVKRFENFKFIATVHKKFIATVHK